MATKTANVLARVEPDIKAKAEGIMAQLGVPASVVINMLYKQIIMTKSIPFSLSVSNSFQTLDEMNEEEFELMMQKGLTDANAGNSRSAKSVFNDLRQEFAE
ncbi:type II toxin-antitoxin system RelB/DinJ family antitoxin [Coprobacillus cateniformis]|uniref:type II toxin-antitoxin system RelB/DinJ family antitoxin n=1 Tax=Coprobacillus cateniformis TaxID=100884 RepID=UPI00241F84EA|nr:type II toxin-antitoxin system RelB/DinJ family antitoxin [Coprobacillus cateniformis]